MIIRGLGQEDEYIADLVLIENKFKLGVTEPDVLKSVHTAATKLCEMESEARTNLRNEGQTEIKDLVSRAYGILKHAHALQIEETLTSLSLFELGKDLGWVEGGEDLSFKKSFFTTRRAHLHENLQKGLSQTETTQTQCPNYQEDKQASAGPLGDAQVEETAGVEKSRENARTDLHLPKSVLVVKRASLIHEKLKSSNIRM